MPAIRLSPGTASPPHPRESGTSPYPLIAAFAASEPRKDPRAAPVLDVPKTAMHNAAMYNRIPLR